jgi:hypothetical protein
MIEKLSDEPEATAPKETARERALKILSTNPKWKEVPASGEIFTIGGARPVK